MGVPASVAPKFFYDALGSRLFDAITELREYYPTRTEATVMARHAGDIAQALGTGHTLVDLGAGNCVKAGRLFGTLKPRRYVAVDISVDFLRQALACLQREYPQMEMVGIGMDFSHQLELPPVAGDGPRTLFYPGSSIGNFTPTQARGFLRQARLASQGGALLVGVDLAKPPDVLVAAYDDELGVTAAFNLNVLLHVNKLLRTNFNVAFWQHVALFNQEHSRIEMHLQARQDVRVAWPGGERHFDAGSRILTEYSYKYRRADFERLLRDAGFTEVESWADEREWFAVFTAR
jgi:dimethylhistidine N-methyltransferase